MLLAQVARSRSRPTTYLPYSARFAGLGVPQLGEYAVAGVIPDALLNALLAFLVGGWWLRLGRDKTDAWDER